MSLDNDVYFIKNPLPQIQQDLAVLGCHFLTMAVLNEDKTTNFIRGGHLYLSFDMKEFVIGGGSAHRAAHIDNDGPGYLGTFMSGCASVFRKDTFLQQGGFDEGMFVGFEDFEFSLRLFRAGLKVGASDVRALVHDHPKPSTTDDTDYERTRFARAKLEAAAKHFERKHNYRVWTHGVDEWVRRRERELGLKVHEPEREKAPPTNDRSGRPRIALVVDSNSWALANIARQLIRHLCDEFDLEMLTYDDIGHPATVLEMTKSHDLVHYLWREPLAQNSASWVLPKVESLYGGWDQFRSEVIDPRPITFTVFDHLFLTPAEIAQRMPMFTSLAKGYTVSSRILKRIYEGIAGYPRPMEETPDGVDLSLFHMTRPDRFRDETPRPLKIGWAGNSAWGAWNEEGKHEDPKGFHTVLKPSLRILKERGLDFEERFADKQIHFIPHDKMPAYYNSIDVLVCCSAGEGTPNPVLEAMACGVPVVSTNVGIVSEAFGERQREFMLKERTQQALAAALESLMSRPSLLAELSEENLRNIKHWDWSIRADAYRRFFRRYVSTS
jgi:glycosyltransferase involved in cell wall biosynthesis